MSSRKTSTGPAHGRKSTLPIDRVGFLMPGKVVPRYEPHGVSSSSSSSSKLSRTPRSSAREHQKSSSFSTSFSTSSSSSAAVPPLHLTDVSGLLSTQAANLHFDSLRTTPRSILRSKSAISTRAFHDSAAEMEAVLQPRPNTCTAVNYPMSRPNSPSAATTQSAAASPLVPSTNVSVSITSKRTSTAEVASASHPATTAAAPSVFQQQTDPKSTTTSLPPTTMESTVMTDDDSRKRPAVTFRLDESALLHQFSHRSTDSIQSSFGLLSNNGSSNGSSNASSCSRLPTVPPSTPRKSPRGSELLHLHLPPYTSIPSNLPMESVPSLKDAEETEEQEEQKKHTAALQLTNRSRTSAATGTRSGASFLSTVQLDMNDERSSNSVYVPPIDEKAHEWKQHLARFRFPNRSAPNSARSPTTPHASSSTTSTSTSTSSARSSLIKPNANVQSLEDEFVAAGSSLSKNPCPVTKWPHCFHPTLQPPRHFVFVFIYDGLINPFRMQQYLKLDKHPERCWAVLLGYELLFNRIGSTLVQPNRSNENTRSPSPLRSRSRARPTTQSQSPSPPPPSSSSSHHNSNTKAATVSVIPNLIRSSTGRSTEGALYLLSEKQLSVLQSELYPTDQCDRHVLPVWTDLVEIRDSDGNVISRTVSSTSASTSTSSRSVTPSNGTAPQSNRDVLFDPKVEFTAITDPSGLCRHCVQAVVLLANHQNIAVGNPVDPTAARNCLECADLVTPNYYTFLEEFVHQTIANPHFNQRNNEKVAAYPFNNNNNNNNQYQHHYRSSSSASDSFSSTSYTWQRRTASSTAATSPSLHDILHSTSATASAAAAPLERKHVATAPLLVPTNSFAGGMDSPTGSMNRTYSSSTTTEAQHAPAPPPRSFPRSQIPAHLLDLSGRTSTAGSTRAASSRGSLTVSIHSIAAPQSPPAAPPPLRVKLRPTQQPVHRRRREPTTRSSDAKSPLFASSNRANTHSSSGSSPLPTRPHTSAPAPTTSTSRTVDYTGEKFLQFLHSRPQLN